MPIMASVAISGWTRPIVTTMPLNRPQPAPTATASIAAGSSPSAALLGEDHRRQRHHGRDRQVETARHHHQELADRENAEQCRLGQQVAEIARGKEHRRDQRGDGGDDEQDDEDVIRCQEGAEAARRARAFVRHRRRAHAASPLAAPTA